MFWNKVQPNLSSWKKGRGKWGREGRERERKVEEEEGERMGGKKEQRIYEQRVIDEWLNITLKWLCDQIKNDLVFLEISSFYGR